LLKSGDSAQNPDWGVVGEMAMFQQLSQSFVLADRANFVVHPMLISVLGAGSVTEHGGSDLISSADASESLARSTNGGE
jgi:hypothetical protein